ncbi:hypothetical protein scyTo_0009931 [Scyliorhinus torazame]|uniref:Ig-like domain-containing protein n=1 Tax=Scyliorhinus torazame TaxID=75743 RepID=A0A401NWD4_SCYTO|nr:hypothetical protein [Scyliorhinus torazame]
MITVVVVEFKMVIPNSQMRGQRGGFLKLQCIVKLNENLTNTLTVFWTKDNENCSQSMPINRHSIDNQTTATDTRDFTLTLVNLQIEDAGVYYCCAAAYSSSQIITIGSINVQVQAFNTTLLNLFALIICKVIILVIVLAVGQIWVCKQKW